MENKIIKNKENISLEKVYKLLQNIDKKIASNEVIKNFIIYIDLRINNLENLLKKYKNNLSWIDIIRMKFGYSKTFKIEIIILNYQLKELIELRKFIKKEKIYTSYNYLFNK